MLCLHSAGQSAANASPDVRSLSGRSPRGASAPGGNINSRLFFFRPPLWLRVCVRARPLLAARAGHRPGISCSQPLAVRLTERQRMRRGSLQRGEKRGEERPGEARCGRGHYLSSQVELEAQPPVEPHRGGGGRTGDMPGKIRQIGGLSFVCVACCEAKTVYIKEKPQQNRTNDHRRFFQSKFATT